MYAIGVCDDEKMICEDTKRKLVGMKPECIVDTYDRSKGYTTVRRFRGCME